MPPDDFVFDPDAFHLARGGEVIDLEPQALDVLAHLVANRDRLVTKDELIDQVWGDRFVSESALTTRIKQLRQALGDDGRTQRFVKTVHGRGYRFVGPITVAGAPGSGATPAPPNSDVGSDPGAISPRPDGQERRHNLPTERTTLIGRDGDIARILDQVVANRLVNLLAMGGTGKTRLAAAVGRAAVDRFATRTETEADGDGDGRFGDGVWFIDLVPHTGVDEIATAMARAIGISLDAGDPLEQLASRLDRRRLLVVLDNCEHVVDEVGEVVDTLLARTETTHFLLTSREPVDLPDEHRVSVEPLTIGDQGSAVDLFFVSADRFGVTLDENDRPSAAALCRRLDGLPLAIELAAAQLRHLDLAQLIDRLDRRFELLVGGRRGGRHRSLAAVLDSSWAGLTDDERSTLGLLAVLPGPFTLDDYEELTAGTPASLATLAGLTDRSLVERSPERARPYRLLESVRAYATAAGDSLGSDGDRRGDDTDGTSRHRAHQERHARWCLDRVGDEVTAHWYDFALSSWCQDHHENLRTAEQFLTGEGRCDEAAELVAALALTMHLDDGARAAEALQRLPAHLEAATDPRLRARLHITGAFSGMAARAPAALAEHALAAEAMARQADDPSVLGAALVLRSWSEIFIDGDVALGLVDEAAELADGVGDHQTVALAQAYRSWHLAVLRRYDEATELAAAVAERGADQTVYPTYAALISLISTLSVVDPDKARGLAVDRFDQDVLHSTWGFGAMLAAAHGAAGDAAAVHELMTTIGRRVEAAGQHPYPDLLVGATALARHRGRDDLARRWIRAVRDAGRPTQSLQVTVAYRRLREFVEPAADDPFAGASLAEIGREAADWVASEAG